MIPVIVIFVYLAIIAFIGSIAFRQGKDNTEDFFLANRSIGSMVFFLSLFATNMTAFAILGSSGQAYRQGIGIFGMMASSSCLVIPLTIFFIGTRLWALGKKFGHQTQVSFFRDRWECNHIGTVIFALSAAMLVPYMIISIMGGGTVLADISTSAETHQPLIPYAWGCAVVAVVVTLNVFLGGMRGTVWVNILQTTLFLCFGAVAVAWISHALPLGFSDYMGKLASDPKTRFLVTRERMAPQTFWSYTLIPLSSIMFPHMAIMCFSARRVTAFKQTVIAYPLAILAIWLPCVFLGFIVVVTVIAYLVALALKDKQGIFEIAVRYAFSGFAAMSPVMVAAMFWRRSTKWGALAATLFVAASLIATGFLQGKPAAATPSTNAPVTAKPKEDIIWQIGQGPDAIKILSRAPNGDVRFLNGYMTVFPLVLGSILCVVLFSLATPPPSRATIAKYFESSPDTTPTADPLCPK